MCDENKNSKITIFEQGLWTGLSARQYYSVKTDEVPDYKGTCHRIGVWVIHKWDHIRKALGSLSVIQ